MINSAAEASDVYELYFHLMKDTESPYLYHRWCLISAMGAVLGRDIWLPFGSTNIYPNTYICLIGSPGARKSTAIRDMGKILEDSGYEYFVGDRSSKEKFMLDWEFGFDRINKGEEAGKSQDDNLDQDLFGDDESSAVSEAYIKAGELEDFLGGGNSGFVSTLTNLWDNLPKYTDRFKNSKSLLIPNPTLSLLGGATATTFANIFGAGIIGQGMLSRLLLIYGAGARQKITIPPPLDPGLRSILVEHLHELRLKLKGPCTLAPAAMGAIDHIYKNQVDLEDGRLASYCSRRLDHLLKVCIITAALDMRLEITRSDVIKANTILTYTENFMPKALGEFGKSKLSEVTNTVMEGIQSQPLGITITDLMKKVSADLDKRNDLVEILQKLQLADKIYVDGTKFYASKSKLKKDSKYIDYSLLLEWREEQSSKKPDIIKAV